MLRTYETKTLSMSAVEAGQIFVTPEAFADMDRFHQAARVLRETDPVHLVEHPDYPPFWVLT